MEDPQDVLELDEELSNMLHALEERVTNLAVQELRRPSVRPHRYHHQPHQPHYPQEQHPQQPQDAIERHINVQCDECGEGKLQSIWTS